MSTARQKVTAAVNSTLEVKLFSGGKVIRLD